MTSLVKKYFMALSGFGLMGFVIVHLLGNLALYLPEGNAFNEYAHRLNALGPVLYLLEIGLLGIFFIHVVFAIQITLANRAARPVSYQYSQTKGGPTKNTFFSRNMIISGLILLGFIIFHVYQFKFGPNVDEGYVTTVQGVEMRDLYRLVAETFQRLEFVGLYVAAMIFLGLHLRHGFWSAFQSLGIAYPKYSYFIYTVGFFTALILAAGFLFIPIWLYLKGTGVI